MDKDPFAKNLLNRRIAAPNGEKPWYAGTLLDPDLTSREEGSLPETEATEDASTGVARAFERARRGALFGKFPVHYNADTQPGWMPGAPILPEGTSAAYAGIREAWEDAQVRSLNEARLVQAREISVCRKLLFIPGAIYARQHVTGFKEYCWSAPKR